jgi:hypothetical protein
LAFGDVEDLDSLPANVVKYLHFIAAIALTAAVAHGSVSIFDGASAPAAEERVALEAATQAMKASGKYLPALEKLIASFPSEMLDSIGLSVSYQFRDPTLQGAWTALLDWYSIDFLEQAMTGGSDDAAYWAIRKLSEQAMNGPGIDGTKNESASTRRLMKRGGVVDNEVKKRLIPALEKLRAVKSDRTRREAHEFIASSGLLTDRQEVIKSLQETDEVLLNSRLVHLLDTVRIDPQLGDEVWRILAKAKTENLALTCFRYPWLFNLPVWDTEKTRVLEGYLETVHGGVATNVNTALTVFAMSSNPLAGEILASLDTTNNDSVKGRVAEYRRIYRQHQPSRRR